MSSSTGSSSTQRTNRPANFRRKSYHRGSIQESSVPSEVTQLTPVDVAPGPKSSRGVVDGKLTVTTRQSFDNDYIFCGDVLTKKHVIALGLSHGIIALIEVKNENTPLRNLDHGRNEDPRLPVTSVHFLRGSKEDNLLLASYASGYTSLWKWDTGEILWNITEDRQTLVNALTSDMLVLGGDDAKITLYDLETQKLVRTFARGTDEELVDGHVMRIFALKFRPKNSQEMVSGGWDNTVQIWDVRKPQSVRRISGPHICGDGIDFMEGGNEIITASWTSRNALQRWDYNTCSLLEDFDLDSYTSYLYCCRFVASGYFMLTGGGNDNMMRVFDLNSRTTIASYRQLSDAVMMVHEVPQHIGVSRETNFNFYVVHGCCLDVLDFHL